MISLWNAPRRSRRRSFLGEYLKNLLRSQRARQTGQRPSADRSLQNLLHTRVRMSGCVLPARRCSAS
jgi:hypothetical protein